MRLSEIFPQPRSVSLGGRSFVVQQLRVKDLAALQAFAESKCPSPLDLRRDEISTLPYQSPEWCALLSRIEDELVLYNPGWCSGEALQSCVTPEGIGFFLHVVLSQCQEISLSECVQLAGEITVPEWLALTRFVWAQDAWSEWEATVDPHPPKDAHRPPSNWAKNIASLCEIYHLSPLQLAELPLGTYRALASRGERSTSGVSPTLAVLRFGRILKGRDPTTGEPVPQPQPAAEVPRGDD